MLGRTILKTAAVLVVPLATLSIAGSASASPSPNVSFSASNDGASAGWTHGKGSAIELTLGSDSASTFAVITFHHFAPTDVAALDEPTFSTDNYHASSPRFYITLSDSDTLWGYPANSGLNGSDFAWAINNGNTYESWSAVQAAEGAAKVTGAYVIADGDQAPGVTDTITGLSFDGHGFN